MSKQSSETYRNDRAKAIKYHRALKERYGLEIFSKSRKRETVLTRRMIITFMVNEKKYKECFIAKIFNVSHAAIFYFIKPIIDKEFERFYRKNFETLKLNFLEIENNIQTI